MSTPLTYKGTPIPWTLPDIIEGDDWQFQFILKDGTGTILNLNQYSYLCQFRIVQDDTQPLFVTTPTIDIPTATVTFSLDHATTAGSGLKDDLTLIGSIVQIDSVGKHKTLFWANASFKVQPSR